LCAGCAHGAELARLTNGFNLRCERHEELGGLTRLYTDAQGTGFIDVPTERVSGYEPALETLPEPAAKAPTVPEHIARAGVQTGIDPDFIHSVIKAESGYNANAVSPKGAQGLMQLMPATAAKLGVHDSLDPANNIDGGSRYLRELLLRYNGDAIRALAAYNAGPESVEKYKGVPPYSETRNYVARVINDFNRRKLCPNQRNDGACSGPLPAASNPPVNANERKQSVAEGNNASKKPRQTAPRKSAVRKTPGVLPRKGEEATRAILPLSARNQPR
jgi:hypothetical protein